KDKPLRSSLNLVAPLKQQELLHIRCTARVKSYYTNVSNRDKIEEANIKKGRMCNIYGMGKQGQTTAILFESCCTLKATGTSPHSLYGTSYYTNVSNRDKIEEANIKKGRMCNIYGMGKIEKIKARYLKRFLGVSQNTRLVYELTRETFLIADDNAVAIYTSLQYTSTRPTEEERGHPSRILRNVCNARLKMDGGEL
ncbi:hypothetical protein C0J52_27167, partial [Blattella germanica]